MEHNKFLALKLNTKFIDYINDKKDKTVKNMGTNNKHKVGYIPEPTPRIKYNKENIAKISAVEDLPSKYDLREEGKISSIKDQGDLGACWAFSTCASLESKLLPNEERDFSENNMINLHGFDYSQDDGGNYSMASAYLTKWGGPMDEKDDPYIGRVSPSPSDISPIKHVQQIMFIPERENYTDNSTIKSLIMQYGAIAVSIYYDESKYNSSRASYYYNRKIDSINHGVAIIGWDDNYDRYNFSVSAPGNGAFIAKNSWGSDWGSQGYFYISYYDTTITAESIYTSIEDADNYNRVYQYDEFGYVSALYDSTKNYICMANMFTAKEDDYLSAVSFYTLNSPLECEIQIYVGCSDTPDSGTLATTKGFSSTMYGYQTIELDELVELKSNEKFSIVVKLTGSSNTSPYVAMEVGIKGYSSGVTINSGESFIKSDETSWTDMYDMNDLFDGSETAGNVCLKGFTTLKEEPDNQPDDQPDDEPDIQPTIYFEPELVEVMIDDDLKYSEEFIIKVAIKDLLDNQSVLGLHDKITFNPEMLEVVRYEKIEDSLLNPIIGEMIVDIDNKSGIIDFNLVRSDTVYPGSTGIVYNIVFKAKSLGTTTVTHEVVNLRDSDNIDITINTQGGTIDISTKQLEGDFNNDGNIDFEDLMLFGKAWGHRQGDIGWDIAIDNLYGTPYKNMDIGPSEGNPPSLTIEKDGVIDIEDYNSFVKLWKWKNS